MAMATIVLFSHNLRLKDNVPLHTAASEGPVLPVFILDREPDDDWQLGGASNWWLHNSLLSLSHDIEKIGNTLILRKGNSYLELQKIIEETGINNVYFEQSLLPGFDLAEDRINKLCKRYGGTARRFRGQTLFHPTQILTNAGTPYRVFTGFWNRCLSIEALPMPLPQPQLSRIESPIPSSMDVRDLGLLPDGYDWSTKLHSHWNPGEAQAEKALNQFIDAAVDGYGDARDIPGIADGTSGLSPHLHFGEISPITVWDTVLKAVLNEEAMEKPAKSFLREIGWREFSYHLMYHFKNLTDEPLNKGFNHFPWVTNDTALTAWQMGQTGYPIVDAGMRQLWQTGWMHNRVRMIVASFLVKDLRVHWREGAQWFWDTLLDADLASNTISWQWVAGCGADAAPYFRIFNPTLQGKKFDPDGDYVRKFVPELAELPKKYIHEPWLADTATLADAGITLGDIYPKPIVDHKLAREEALAAYQITKHANNILTDKSTT